LYAHPARIVHLNILFNLLCKHGFVPDPLDKVLSKLTTCFIKDRLGDISSTSNYRPITLNPVISKLFEYSILHKF